MYGLIPLFSFMCVEMLSASLTEEVQRMRRKRQLNMELSENRNLDDSSSDSSSENTFPSSAKDKPLFTFRQVNYLVVSFLKKIYIYIFSSKLN